MFDCHIHSNFSGDSDMPVEAACNKAIALGLDGITFTDHLDHDFPYFDITFMINFDTYSKDMEEIKRLYEGRLKVLKGIEVGIQPHVIEATDEDVKLYDFDFVIASTHVIDRLDPYRGEFYEGKTKEQAYRRYLEEIYHAVTNFQNYDVVGHIGYIRRYGKYDDRSLRHQDYSDILDAILKRVISDGKGIEVNTSGYRTNLNSPIPDYDIIQRYRELGGEIITLGSDAHNVEHLAIGFETARDMLKSIGFKYTAHFEKRKPIFDLL